MADDFVHVNYATLSTGQNDLAGSYQTMTETLDTLKSQLNSSLAAWEDDARDAYTLAQAEWDKISAHLVTVLNQLGGVIGTAHENYTGVEKANAKMWQW